MFKAKIRTQFVLCVLTGCFHPIPILGFRKVVSYSCFWYPRWLLVLWNTWWDPCFDSSDWTIKQLPPPSLLVMGRTELLERVCTCFGQWNLLAVDKVGPVMIWAAVTIHRAICGGWGGIGWRLSPSDARVRPHKLQRSAEGLPYLYM